MSGNNNHWSLKLVDNAGWVALACVALTSVFYAGLIEKGVRIDNRPEAFASADSDAPDILNSIREQFGRDDLFVVLIDGDIRNASYVSNLQNLENAIQGMTFESETPEEAPAVVETAATDSSEGEDWGGDDWGDESPEEAGVALNPIDQTISLISVRRTTGSEGSITVEELFDTGVTDLTSDQFIERIQTNQFAVENLVSEDFRYSALLVQTEPMEDVVNTKFYFALKSIVEAESKTDFSLMLVGLPALIAQMDQDTQKNIGAITMAALLVMSIVLLTLFRYWSAIVGPLIVVIVGSIWSFGFMAWTGVTMNYVSAIIPGFLIIVGLADAIHLQSSYASKLSTSDSPREALAAAVAKTAVPIAFTSFTTMVGLMSFRAASVEAVRELGFSGSIGILGAMVSTLMVLPFFLRLHRQMVMMLL